VGPRSSLFPEPARPRRRGVARAGIACAGVALLAGLGAATALPAQTLAPRRTLTTGAAPGCDLAPAATASEAPRNTAEARRLSAQGQEAALVGDQGAARDAFARAAQLNPADERLLYDLARAHEALSDTVAAVGSYCQYLTLAPAGSEAADVRTRLGQLVPGDARQRAEDAQVAFRLGLGFLDDRQYPAAVRAFDEVVRLAPSAPEGPFNRALARAATGRRAEALADLETARVAESRVAERLAIARAIDVLRRPVYSPAGAFLRGVLPGAGQFYTGRPVRGTFVLALVAGSVGAALTPRTTEREIAYTDPNGVPAPYTEVVRERPWFVPGVAAAAGLTLISAIEASVAANRSQRGASILALASSLQPVRTPRGETGLALSLRF
jgi:tetratricopeptide (TPR) repeat protein